MPVLNASRTGRRLSVALLAAALVAAAVPAIAGAAAPAKDSYIVVLKDRTDSRSVAADHRARYGARVGFVYEHALKGYSARIAGRELGALRSDPQVAYVEHDREVRASAPTTQSGATWGIDRIDQRPLPLSGTYGYERTGAGVKAYVIDTGIRFAHTEFGGRAVSGTDKIDGGSADDCDGHGTHVAGTIGGATYGVAKGVSLVGVRVLDCNGSGTWSGVIAGIDWVTGDHQAGAPAVANMSLGGGVSSAVDDAVQRSIDDGVSYAIAAGNGNQGGKAQDACGSSPARVGAAMTIGATTQTDTKTSWSNYGACVDWFAPGYQITSAWNTSNTATNTISGTSMATPHVAGAAALELEGTPSASPAAVRDALYAATTKGVVTSSSTANNHLLYVGPADGTVTDPGGGTGGGVTYPIALTARGYKVKGVQSVDLTWTGTTAAVDVYRDGTVIGSGSGGAYTDDLNRKGSGSYTYRVCEAGSTATCSADVTVVF